MMGKTVRGALKATAPIMAGYLFLGFAYGITAKEAGIGTLWVFLCSASIYAGSMQFAMLPILQTGFSPLTMLVMTLLVNARHLFYGLTMLQPYSELKQPWRTYDIFALTDETYSLVVRGVPEGEKAETWYTLVSALDHAYWMLGSVAGAILGRSLPFDLTGIDFAMTALFTVIVTEQTMDALHAWRQGEITRIQFWLPLILGLGVTCLCLAAVGKGSFLIAAMALMMIVLGVRYRYERRTSE